MSDINVFQAIKENYAHDTLPTAKQYWSLHEQIRQEQKTNSPHLAQDERDFTIFNLAIADLKADNHDGSTASIMYKEAIDSMKAAKKASANVTGLEELVRQVGRKIS